MEFLTNDQLLQIIEEAVQNNSTELDLTGNSPGISLSFLPPQIAQLTALEKLSLSGNLSLKELPPEIGRLTNLVYLDLRFTDLKTLPPEIGKLIKLRELYLSSRALVTIPKEIGSLTNLRRLRLGGFQAERFPKSGAYWQDPDESKLQTLPSELWNLVNLTHLNLSCNRLTSLSSDIGTLTRLKELDLQDNNLTELPVQFANLTNLQLLALHHNPLLKIPYEILAQYRNPAKIIDFYLQLRRSERKPLNEAKILIVGQGGVGKTSLIKRLLINEFDPYENKTEGIDINSWNVDINGQEVHLNIWDFGGQEIMHTTHQFFLTKRSLYLLVLDARQGEQESRLEYWLRIIQSFGDESPVIVISNKCDQQLPNLDRRGLCAKYPFIKDFIEVSCLTGQGVEKLKETIITQVSKLDYIHDEIPSSWFTVKTKLEGMKEEYISYDHFKIVCQTEDITEERDQQILLDLLHDLGVVLNFSDDFRLKETNILNPEWITEGVYQILNSNILFQSKGVLLRQMLLNILDSNIYPSNTHPLIIDIMRKFELCFDFEGFTDQKFLIPDLLSREEPYTGEWSLLHCLGFQIHYNILPSSVISRFMVRSNVFIHKNTYWRNGVVLTYGGNRALIKADFEERRVFIYITGRQETRRDFLAIIRAQFEYIHRTIPKLEAKEKIPLPNHPNVVIDYQHLLLLERLGETTYIPEGVAERINIKQLLYGIGENSNQQRNDSAMIKILFLTANPSDTTRLRLDEESRSIDQALRQAQYRDNFEIKQHWAVRASDLQGLMLRHKPHIVHFSGHGSEASEIIIEDNSGNSHPLSVRALSQLFSVLKDNIRCVILNACYSKQQAQAISEHIDCVIGMSKAIGDSAAISFATAFYQALGYGKDVKTAFNLGCVQIDLENLNEQDTPKLIAINRDPKNIMFV